MNEDILKVIANKKKYYPDCASPKCLDHNPTQLVLSGDKQEVIDFMDIFNFLKNLGIISDVCIKSNEWMLDLNNIVDFKLKNVKFTPEMSSTLSCSTLIFYGLFLCFAMIIDR